MGRRRVGDVDKVLCRKVAVGRSDDVVVDVILTKLGGGASGVIVRLDAWVKRSRRLGSGLGFLVLVVVDGGGAHFVLTVVKVVSGERVRGGGSTRPGLQVVQFTLAVAGAVASGCAALEQVFLRGASNCDAPRGLLGVSGVVLHLA